LISDKGKTLRGPVQLQKIQPDMKLVEPDNIHLTLRFLGEVAEEKLPELIQAISVVENYPAFELDLRGIRRLSG